MLILDVVLFGVYGIVIWAVQMLWIPVFAAGVINGVGHYFGYRNFEPPDASTNIVPWGILIGGEELHNNHHAFPSSARLSSKRWEFDIGWMYIRILQALRLAKVRRVAPNPRVVPGKSQLDLETLRAVITSRMHVFARYGKEVMGPVSREELCRDAEHCKRLVRRARRLLLTEGKRLDVAARSSLEQLLAKSQTLATVYQFRERLQEIWDRKAPSQEALLHALQDWCQQAEATGIHALGALLQEPARLCTDADARAVRSVERSVDNRHCRSVVAGSTTRTRLTRVLDAHALARVSPADQRRVSFRVVNSSSNPSMPRRCATDVN